LTAATTNECSRPGICGFADAGLFFYRRNSREKSFGARFTDRRALRQTDCRTETLVFYARGRDSMAERSAKRTRIDDISVFGESLSDAEMRLVSGGDGATSTADNRTCDEDGTPGGSVGGGGGEWTFHLTAG
jgi:hypothetical protein